MRTIPTSSEAEQLAKLVAEKAAMADKVCRAIFYHFEKHHLDAVDALLCLSSCYAIIIRQQTTEKQQIELADTFQKMIDPNYGKKIIV